MMEQLQQFIKDPSKMARLTIGCFFAAVILSTYFLFTLPNDLVYDGGMIDSHRATSVFVKLSVVIGIAFAFCYAAIHYLQISKREIIVYLDKKIENNSSQFSSSSTGASSLSAALVRESIDKAKTKDEKYQSGLNQFCHQLNAGQGAFYLAKEKSGKKILEMKCGFALVFNEGEQNPSYEFGEGLIGQVAASGKSLYLDELPEGYAARIESGLGNALPKFLFVFPIQKENQIKGVIEIATFVALSVKEQEQAQEIGNSLAEI